MSLKTFISDIEAQGYTIKCAYEAKSSIEPTYSVRCIETTDGGLFHYRARLSPPSRLGTSDTPFRITLAELRQRAEVEAEND